jgi:hypothetical protein
MIFLFNNSLNILSRAIDVTEEREKELRAIDRYRSFYVTYGILSRVKISYTHTLHINVYVVYPCVLN